ncbi:hypothetical protein QJS04_geneDACA016132 [Acorus gramineus]|uniref:Uncharacterized protein n=1 Tax=Acorus gramineus TaxID=55184 RepID=A0AAV8ZYU1_ACOGR|nr:hypothetical protein QJS04_geneDACA024247 [Acorus gramineus]KAK1264437.1 hypothetical protein QJS04_geneDACA016132 [Acorus gramineus]
MRITMRCTRRDWTTHHQGRSNGVPPTPSRSKDPAPDASATSTCAGSDPTVGSPTTSRSTALIRDPSPSTTARDSPMASGTALISAADEPPSVAPLPLIRKWTAYPSRMCKKKETGPIEKASPLFCHV